VIQLNHAREAEATGAPFPIIVSASAGRGRV